MRYILDTYNKRDNEWTFRMESEDPHFLKECGRNWRKLGLIDNSTVYPKVPPAHENFLMAARRLLSYMEMNPEDYWSGVPGDAQVAARAVAEQEVGE